MAKKSWLKRHKHGLLVGGIMGFVLAIGVFGVGYYYWKKSNDENQIIAPYYNPNDLKNPPPTRGVIKAEKIMSTTVKIPIIMYHYVEYVKDINDIVKRKLAINPAYFEQQLKTLKDNDYQTYFERDMPDIISGKTKIASRSAVLTFDDGYEDFYLDVVPLLKKYQMKATIFIINDYLNRKGFLTTDEVKDIAANYSDLVEIGAHTLDHVYLKYTPTSLATKEVNESKAQLEALIGKPVVSFAYPYGAFSNETINLVKDAGFSSAVSVIPGSIHSKDTLFVLHRIRAGALVAGPSMVHFLDNYTK